MNDASKQSDSQQIRIRQVSWQQHSAVLHALREAVFINEQHVDPALEWDGLDHSARHYLLEVQQATNSAHWLPVAVARVLDSGQIGRMAVLKQWRGQGLGSRLLDFILSDLRARGRLEVFLHAQTHALGFYRQFGFQAQGEEFIDADMPHRHMSLYLGPEGSGQPSR